MILLFVYFFLVVTGAFYLGASFVFGELADSAAHAVDGVAHAGEGFLESVGDWIEGILGGFGIDSVHLDAPDFSGDFDMDHEIGESHPSIFSLRVLVMFFTGVGAGGLIGYGMGLEDTLTLIPAFFFGLFGAVLMYYLLKWFYSGQIKGTTGTGDYINTIGTITTSIPEGGAGGVDVTVRLVRKTLPAVSRSGKAIPSGIRVYIHSMQEGGTAVVDVVE